MSKSRKISLVDGNRQNVISLASRLGAENSQKVGIIDVAFHSKIREKTGFSIGRYNLFQEDKLIANCDIVGCDQIGDLIKARIVSVLDSNFLETGINQLPEEIQNIVRQTNGDTVVCLNCQLEFMIAGINQLGIKRMGITSLKKPKSA